MPYDNDPLWRMRHALAGMALALVASVLLAAVAGSALAPLFGDSYGTRLTIYLLLLAYVIVGAVLLFMRVARYETQALSAGRALRWLLSLWLWPLLLMGRRRTDGEA
jgi:MFS family permease